MARHRRSRVIDFNDDLAGFVGDTLKTLMEYHGNYSSHVSNNRGVISGTDVTYKYAGERIRQVFNEVHMHNNHRIQRGVPPHQLQIVISTLDNGWVMYESVKPQYKVTALPVIDPIYDSFFSRPPKGAKYRSNKKTKV